MPFILSKKDKIGLELGSVDPEEETEETERFTNGDEFVTGNVDFSVADDNPFSNTGKFGNADSKIK